MSKFKKFKNEELLICLQDCDNNARKHPTQEGRKFFKDEVTKMTKEIDKRIESNVWDMEKAMETEQFKMHLRNMKARQERKNDFDELDEITNLNNDLHS